MANYASVANLGDPSSLDWQNKNLVEVKAGNGQKWRVHRDAAKAFEGLFGDLIAAGYNPTSSGGFNYRNIRGGNKLSQHAFGTAIDVNAAANPMLARGASVVTDMPANTGELAKKWGLEWGGTWKRPDAMHFEWLGPQGGDLPATVSTTPVMAGKPGAVGGVPAQTVETTPVAPTLADMYANAQAASFTPPTVGDAIANFLQTRATQQQVQAQRDTADMERRRALFGDLGSLYG